MADRKRDDYYIEVAATDPKDEPDFLYTEVPATDADGNPISPKSGSKSGKPAADSTKE